MALDRVLHAGLPCRMEDEVRMHRILNEDRAQGDILDVYRGELRASIHRTSVDRANMKALRDSIAPLRRKFDDEAWRLWNQFDDYINGLDATLCDAPKFEEGE